MQNIQTTVAIVGGGPAGAVLGLLLARVGVDVTLLEQHADFDRQFRGDSLHPSVLELIEELGLIDQLLALPHSISRGIPTETDDGPVEILDLAVLKSKYPYFLLVQQSRFLEFITEQAQQLPNFRVIMRASVRRLLEEENGAINGVAFQTDDGWCEVRAALTIAADGRHSMVRKLAGLQPQRAFESPTDSVWFRVPRAAGDRDSSIAYVRNKLFAACLHREDHWQIALNVPKGSYSDIKAAGLEVFKARISSVLPNQFAARVAGIPDFKAFNLLAVEANRLEHWFRPGLLLIGDAAHTMSPALGVGINLAIQDAVATANLLSAACLNYQRSGAPIPISSLAEVQRKREPITKVIHRVQAFASQQQVRVFAGKPMFSPLNLWLSRMKWVKYLLARLVGLGWTPERWRFANPRDRLSV